MKKQFLNLGKALNKAEQKLITGGYMPKTACETFWDCSLNELACVDGECTGGD